MAVHKLYYPNLEIDFTDGYGMLRDFVPQIATPTADGSVPFYLQEILPLHIQATSADNLATLLDNLADVQRYAIQYDRTPHYAGPVWYHQRLEDETGERRAYVRNVTVSAQQSYFAPPAPEDWVPVNLGIERHPYWETTSSIAMTSSPDRTSPVFVYDDIGTVAGNVPARIQKLGFSWSGFTPDRFWIGIRQSDRSSIGFCKTWECEDATAPVTSTPDSDASNGYHVAHSPGSENTWEKVIEINLYSVADSGYYGDNFGEFLWLLRARVAGGTWEVRLRFGLLGMDDDDYVRSDKVIEMTNTSYDLYNAGVSMIPPIGYKLMGTDESAVAWRSSIEIWARRTAVGGNLILDCLIPIPVDKGYLFVENAAAAGSSGYLRYYCRPDDSELVIARQAGFTASTSCKWRSSNFRLWPGACFMVVAFARDGSSSIDDTVTAGVNSAYFPRYCSLRGGG